jgi:hypothetical protein
MVRPEKLFHYVISTLLLSLFICHSVQGAANEKDTIQGSGAYGLSLTLTNGLLAIEADNAPLGEVLEELFKKTGTEFIVRTPSLSADPLSVSFRNLAVPEAIERVLRRYNYILKYGGSNDATRVIILALQSPGEPLSGGMENGGTFLRVGLSATLQPPKSLDECQKLDLVNDVSSLNKVDLYSDPKSLYLYENQVREERKMALDDAKIRRTEKVLRMEQCSHLWEQAIDELAFVQDERVSGLLADTASNGETIALRTKATKALWNHTARSEFKNVQGMNILEELATSSDEGVRVYAQGALQDYERYISRTQSGIKK